MRRALARPYTYAPWRNPYAAFGLLWGVPVPLVCAAIHLSAAGEALTVAGAMRWLLSGALPAALLAHPLLFMVVFGAVGTRIDELIATDGLTGLLNHRAFQQRLRQEAAGSLMMIDVDRFKAFNDLHGHPAGDVLLRALARRLQSCVRPYDVVCRYGGEEFAVILPATSCETAGEIAERTRASVAEAPFRLSPDRECRVTISIGVASRRDGEPATEWIERADRRLYASKGAGRNCVTTANEETMACSTTS